MDMKEQKSVSTVLFKKVKTSEHDYRVFRRTFMRAVKLLGLTHYEYTFAHVDDEENAAGCRFEPIGPGVFVYLSKQVPVFIHERGMESLAVHEALHVLLRPFDVWMFPDGEEILYGSERHMLRIHTIHAVIQRLMPVVTSARVKD